MGDESLFTRAGCLPSWISPSPRKWTFGRKKTARKQEKDFVLEATIGYSHTPAVTPRVVGDGGDKSQMLVRELEAAIDMRIPNVDFTAAMTHGLDAAPPSSLFEPDIPLTFSGEDAEMDALATDIPQAGAKQQSDHASRIVLPPQPAGLGEAIQSVTPIDADAVCGGPEAQLLPTPHRSCQELPKSPSPKRPTPPPRPRTKETHTSKKNVPITSSSGSSRPSTWAAESKAGHISRFIEDSLMPSRQKGGGGRGGGEGGGGGGDGKAATRPSQVMPESKPMSSQLPPPRLPAVRRMKFDKPPPWEGKENKIVPGLQIETPRKIQINARDLVPALALSNITSFVAPPPDPASPRTINPTTSSAKLPDQEKAKEGGGGLSLDERTRQEVRQGHDESHLESAAKSAYATPPIANDMRSPRLLDILHGASSLGSGSPMLPYPQQLNPHSSSTSSQMRDSASFAHKAKVPVVLATTAANRLNPSSASLSSSSSSAALQRQRLSENLKSPRVLKTTTVWASTDSSASAQITRRDSAPSAPLACFSAGSMVSRHAAVHRSQADGDSVSRGGATAATASRREALRGQGHCQRQSPTSSVPFQPSLSPGSKDLDRVFESLSSSVGNDLTLIGSDLSPVESRYLTPRTRAAVAGYRELVC